MVLFVEVFLYCGSKAWINEKVSYFKINLEFFDGFGATFFAYMSQPNYYEIIGDLEKRDCVHQKRVLDLRFLINYA